MSGKTFTPLETPRTDAEETRIAVRPEGLCIREFWDMAKFARQLERELAQLRAYAGPYAGGFVPSETVPIEKARERIAGIEEYLARQKTTSVKEEQAHLVEGSDASLYWHFGYMMALKDIFRLSGKQQDQDGKIFQ